MPWSAAASVTELSRADVLAALCAMFPRLRADISVILLQAASQVAVTLGASGCYWVVEPYATLASYCGAGSMARSASTAGIAAAACWSLNRSFAMHHPMSVKTCTAACKRSNGHVSSAATVISQQNSNTGHTAKDISSDFKKWGAKEAGRPVVKHAAVHASVRVA